MNSFIIFVILIFTVNTVNTFVIIRNADGIICDGYKCPDNSASCVISYKTQPDLLKIDYIRQCLDSRGNIIDKFEDTIINPNPGTSVNNYISSGGGIYSSTNTGHYNAAATEEALEQAAQAIADAKDQEEYWNQWTKDFIEDLKLKLAPLKML